MARQKKRPRDEEEYDDEDDYESDDEYDDDDEDVGRNRGRKDDDEPKKPKVKVRNNAFTGMLAISLLALIVAATLFYLDFDALSGTIPQPSVTVSDLGAAVAPGR